MSADLELFSGKGTTLAYRMRAAVQAEGLEALVKDAKTNVRDALKVAVDIESERTGTSFTGKLDGWSAQMTDPDPKPSVTDRQAFGKWVVHSTSLPSEARLRVVVIDHDAASHILVNVGRGTIGNISIDDLFGALKVIDEYSFPADPFTPLLDSGRCMTVGSDVDGWMLVETETGETVPGVTVTRQQPQLRLVPKGKAQRAKARRDVAELLGIPAEIVGGA